MARPREFDEDEARAGVMRAFLTKGYADTSLSDLEAASGLGRKSLYNAFGDKRALFVRALADFRHLAVAETLAPLGGDGVGRAEIAAVYDRLIALADTEIGRLGCLICNTAREDIARHDAEVGAAVTDYFAHVTALMQRAVETAQARGEIAPSRDAATLGQFLMAIVVALSVLARAGAPGETLAAVRDEALTAL